MHYANITPTTNAIVSSSTHTMTINFSTRVKQCLGIPVYTLHKYCA